MKKTKITTLTTAALAATILATTNVNNHTVKADSTDDQTATKAQTPKEVAQTNVDNARKDVENAQAGVDQAQNDLNTAQSEAEDADSKYNAQSDAVSSAQADVNKKSSAASDAQSRAASAAVLVSEASDPTKMEAANDAVKDAEGKVTQANANKSEADQAVAKKNEDITTKSEAASNAQKAVASASAAKSDADKAVSEAQKALNGTGINEVQEKITNYQKNITQLNKNINSNKKMLEQNKKALDKDNETLKNKNNELSTTVKEKPQAEADLKTATNVLRDAQSKLDKDKQIANSAAGFFKSLAENSTLSEDQRNDALMAYNVIMNEGKSAPGYEITFSEDKLNSPKIKVTPENNEISITLPDGGIETRWGGILDGPTKLTWYDDGVHLGQEDDATSLSNMKLALNDLDTWADVRSQYNLSQPKVSLTGIAIAMMSSDYLNSHDFDHPGNHPENGPFYKDEEDIAYGGSQVDLYMSEKEYIDELIAQHPEYAAYRYDTGHLTEEQWNKNNDFWANHGLILSGGGDKVIGHYTSMVEPDKHGIGMAISGGNSSTDIVGGNISYPISLKVVDNDSDWGPEYVDDKVVYPYDSFSITDYKKLVNTYNPTTASFVEEDQKDVKDKQKIKDDKQEKVNSLKVRVSGLNEDIRKLNDTISNTKNSISTINEKITNLGNDLKTENTNLLNARTEYNKLAEMYKELTKNLEESQSKQTEAQNNLNEANATKQAAIDALTTARKELATLKQNAETAAGNVQDAQKVLDKAKNHVSDLQNADAIKKDAEAKIATAKESLDKAKETLEKEQAKLPALEQAKQAADDNVAAAQANLDTANAELDAAKTKLKDAQAKLDKLNKNEAIIDSASTNSKNGAKKVTILNPAAVVVDKEGNIVTTPKTLPAGSQTTSVTPETKTINGKDYVQVGNDEFVPASAVSNIDAKNKTVELKEETEVVDKDGKTIKQPVLAKEVLESSDIDFTDAPVVTINGKKYYQVADNQYIPTSAIKKTTKKEKATKPTKVKLTHNAFVYDKNGKVVKSKTTIKFIRRGKTIKPVNAKTVTIKGKKYYQVGKNQFIKAANAKIKTHPVKIKAVLKTNFKAVDLNGKHNGKTVKSGKKYHFNEKRTINGKTYYKIVWTNNWIPASKLSIRK